MRIEHDFLGEVKLQDDVYYGVQTWRAVNNFPVTGHRLDADFIIAIAIIKKAAAIANMKTSCLSVQIGNAIVHAADEIISGALHEQFVVDCIQGGAGTSMNMNANEVIANRAIELLGEVKGDYQLVSPNNHVNMSQSTNDVIPSAIRLTAVRKTKRLLKTMYDLIENLTIKSIEFRDILKMGRTHLQDAVPITVGQEFAAYAALVKRAAQRVELAMGNLYTINMGATAVGTGLNADPLYIEEVTKQICLLSDEKFMSSVNLVDATQNLDDIAELSASLRVCALGLIKMANDLRLMASGPKCGLNEIVLPAMQPGSSIMPGKINPVMPELVNQVSFMVIGNDQTIGMAVQAGQFELNVMGPVIAYSLFNSLTFLTNALESFNTKCVSGITVNENRCRDMVESSIGVITALIPHIGYETASKIARKAIETSRPVRDILTEEGVMPSEQINCILSPQEMTRPGIAGKQYLVCRR